MVGKEKRYICSHDDCGAAFSRRNRLVIHMRTHTGERPYVCTYDDCNKSYARSSHLNRHEATHEVNSLRCSFHGCSAVLKSAATLKKHVDHKHLKVKLRSYKCSYCDKEFSRHNSVKAHEYKHTGIKPYLCPNADCEKRFLLPSRLKRHMKVHEGYKCLRDSCEVRCPTWNLYLKHLKVAHPPVYQCQVCSKEFSSSWNLGMHRKIHLDLEERPLFFCPVPNCHRSYTEERNMKYHLKKYHEQRPFQCTHDGCALSFKNEDQLRRHCQVHDPNIPLSSKKRKKKLKQKKKKSFAAILSGYTEEEGVKTVCEHKDLIDNVNDLQTDKELIVVECKMSLSETNTIDQATSVVLPEDTSIENTVVDNSKSVPCVGCVRDTDSTNNLNGLCLDNTSICEDEVNAAPVAENSVLLSANHNIAFTTDVEVSV